MGFLFPAGFLVAALAAGATIVLWMLRRLHRDEPVSSTYLWQKLLTDLHAAAPWRRLRRELMWLLQLAAIAALGLALARPYRLSGPPPGSHLLLVIDASASMQATPGGGSQLLDQAVERALSLAQAQLAAGGRVTAIAAGRAPSVLVAGAADLPSLRTGLRRLAPGPAGADLPAALSLAAVVARGEPDARAVLLTDRPVPLPGGELPTEVIALGAPERNLAVAALAVAPGDQGAEAVVRVANRGTQPLDYRLDLQADGALAGSRTGRLEAGAAVDLNFTGLPRAQGFAARLTGGDDLAPDDVAYAALDAAEPLQVLLVSEGNLFVERALGLRPNVRVVRARPQDYAPGPYGLYVFDNWLPDELPPGPLLLIHPPAGQGPVPLGPEEVRVSRVLPGPAAAEWLPVPVDDVAVARARPVRVPAGAQVLLTSPEGPLVLTSELAGRRLALFTFDLRQSDLALRVAFPVLVQNLMGWMAPPAPGPAQAEAGEPLPLDLDPLVTTAEVITPDGRVVPLPAPLGNASFTATDLPGIYRLVQHRAGGDREHRIAVNFPVAESAGEAVPGASAPAPGAAEAAAAAAGLPQPREWAHYLAWAALALLAAEWWVYSRGG